MIFLWPRILIFKNQLSNSLGHGGPANVLYKVNRVHVVSRACLKDVRYLLTLRYVGSVSIEKNQRHLTISRRPPKWKAHKQKLSSLFELFCQRWNILQKISSEDLLIYIFNGLSTFMIQLTEQFSKLWWVFLVLVRSQQWQYSSIISIIRFFKQKGKIYINKEL